MVKVTLVSFLRIGTPVSDTPVNAVVVPFPVYTIAEEYTASE
jgi:hypothetical protein